MNRLTTDKYPWALRREYYQKAARNTAGYPHERFGQWVWNSYGIAGNTWPELFYERDEARVLHLLNVNLTEAAGSC